MDPLRGRQILHRISSENLGPGRAGIAPLAEGGVFGIHLFEARGGHVLWTER